MSTMHDTDSDPWMTYDQTPAIDDPKYTLVPDWPLIVVTVPYDREEDLNDPEFLANVHDDPALNYNRKADARQWAQLVEMLETDSDQSEPRPNLRKLMTEPYDWDQLTDDTNLPDPAPNLAQLASEPRRFTQQ